MSDGREARAVLGDEFVRTVLKREPVGFGPSAPSAFHFLTRLVQEDVFGGLWQRSELDRKTRSLCTIGMLVALERPVTSLKDQIRGALCVGASREEVGEVIVHAAVYAGLPVFTNGMIAAMAVFEEEDTG